MKGACSALKEVKSGARNAGAMAGLSVRCARREEKLPALNAGEQERLRMEAATDPVNGAIIRAEFCAPIAQDPGT